MKNLFILNCVFWVLLVSLVESSTTKDNEDAPCWKNYALYAVAGAASIALAPVALTAAGFTSAGIAAGSIASGMMATAGNVGVGGGVIAAFQSAGAAGLGLAGQALVGTTGAAIAATVMKDNNFCSDIRNAEDEYCLSNNK